MSQRDRQQGFSLIELMIALALGLMLVAGVISLFMATINGNSGLAKTHRLESELHAGMGLMVRDLRRAGYDGSATPQPNFVNPFSSITVGAYAGEAADSCILFSYDLNSNGVVDTGGIKDERFGYRLKQGVLQMRQNGLDCTTNGWSDVTTAALIKVTRLLFDMSTTTDGSMNLRSVTVTLSGQLKSDAGVKRTLVRNVHIRNNLWVP